MARVPVILMACALICFAWAIFVAPHRGRLLSIGLTLWSLTIVLRYFKAFG